eukprot:TRINITY_DN4844_c0_g1_i1.p1 TRINITY_DN4844_c0_g1~~TRINITY_DN4844_c0_g1_i1.p1  ORF type:complete len:682 (+),score=162.38 TRINITY_DN4844_c0_g1_i1:33-2078(+)
MSFQSNTLCRYFSTTGSCMKGDQCPFRHIYNTNNNIINNMQQQQFNLPFPQQQFAQDDKNFIAVRLPRNAAQSVLGPSHTSSHPSSRAVLQTFAQSQSFSQPLLSSTTVGNSPPQRFPVSPGAKPNHIAKNPPFHASGGISPARGKISSPSSKGKQNATTHGLSPSPFIPSQMRESSPGSMLPSVNQPGKSANNFFMTESLREDLVNQISLTAKLSDPLDPRMKDFPDKIGRYQSFVPLDSAFPSPRPSPTLGASTMVFKCINSTDGTTCVLCQIEGNKTAQEVDMQVLNQWRELSHPSIVSLREVLLNKDVPGGNLFFAYDFHPGAITLENLMQQHLVATSSSERCIPEDMAWSILCQLSSAIIFAHERGLSCRTICPSKILLTSRCRVRINGCGIIESLKHDANKNIQTRKQEDILALGCLMLSLLTTLHISEAYPTMSVISPQNSPISSSAPASTSASTSAPASASTIPLSSSTPTPTTTTPTTILVHQKEIPIVGLRHALASLSSSPYYSAGIKEIVSKLTKPFLDGEEMVNDSSLLALVSPHAFKEIDTAHWWADNLEFEATREMDNGRFLRLLIKICSSLCYSGALTESSKEPASDSYIFKAFFEHMFGRLDENGNHIIDLAHILDNLNKIDIGSPEKIAMLNQDESTALVSSYALLKRLFGQTLSEIDYYSKRH